jgi:hypothetical protein
MMDDEVHEKFSKATKTLEKNVNFAMLILTITSVAVVAIYILIKVLTSRPKEGTKK